MPIETTPRYPSLRFGQTLAAGLMGLAIAFSGHSAAAQDAPLEIGIWFDDTGDGAVEIHPCGKQRLCGRIVWLKSPINAEGKPLADRYNPDPAMRARQICGLTILRDLQLMTNGTWDNGYVYDPKKGAEHEAAIRLLSQDKLQLTGFGLGRLLSKSFVWKRAPADIQLCNTPVKAPAQGVTAPPPAGVAKPATAATPGVPAPAPATKTNPAAQAKTDPAQPAATQKKAPAQQAPQPQAPAQATTKPNSSAANPAKPATSGASTAKATGTAAPGTATKPKQQKAEPGQAQGQAAKSVTQVKKAQPATGAAAPAGTGTASTAKPPTPTKAQAGTAAAAPAGTGTGAAADKTAAKKKAPNAPAPDDVSADGTVAPVKKLPPPVTGASADGPTPTVP